MLSLSCGCSEDMRTVQTSASVCRSMPVEKGLQAVTSGQDRHSPVPMFCKRSSRQNLLVATVHLRRHVHSTSSSQAESIHPSDAMQRVDLTQKHQVVEAAALAPPDMLLKIVGEKNAPENRIVDGLVEEFCSLSWSIAPTKSAPGLPRKN